MFLPNKILHFLQHYDILFQEVNALDKKTSKIVEYFQSTVLYEFSIKTFNFFKHHKNIVSIIIILIFALGVATYPIINKMINGTYSENSLRLPTKSDLTSDKIYVTVAGEINNPGVYEMTTDDRVKDAIEKAGGTTQNAYTTNINLAQILKDEQYIYIMTKEEGEKLESQVNYGTSSGFQGIVNINTASVEQLCQLPGIGESTAEKIIEYRESYGGFESIEELKNVKGIGTSKYNEIKNNITI